MTHSFTSVVLCDWKCSVCGKHALHHPDATDDFWARKIYESIMDERPALVDTRSTLGLEEL